MKNPRMKAAEQGKTHYEGQPCKTCGTTQKYTSTGNCVQCSKTATAEQRRKVRELLAQAKAGA